MLSKVTATAHDSGENRPLNNDFCHSILRMDHIYAVILVLVPTVSVISG
jgi:hypothetical protein